MSFPAQNMKRIIIAINSVKLIALQRLNRFSSLKIGEFVNVLIVSKFVGELELMICVSNTDRPRINNNSLYGNMRLHKL